VNESEVEKYSVREAGEDLGKEREGRGVFGKKTRIFPDVRPVKISGERLKKKRNEKEMISKI
jgi:hypothetical protein